MNYTKAILQTFLALVVSVVLYYFYHIEFLRENFEDSAFDVINQFVLSVKEEEVNAPNLMLFKVDEAFLESKNLLENGETKYGYLLPRRYLAQIIEQFDELVSEVEEQNLPQALFLDYDIDYTSDPNNVVFTHDDMALIEVLKKERPYTIYLIKNAHHNYIASYPDVLLQKRIKNKKIVFVSVGFTVSTDTVSRRYYPYKTFLNQAKEEVYPFVAIELYQHNRNSAFDVTNDFSLDKKAFIENRIIFKNYQKTNGEFIQSNWKNYTVYSASHNLFEIPEEKFANAILYIGSTHSNTNDFFTKDIFDRELSGIEMHANALMTLFYFDGKLKPLPLWGMLLIVCFSILIFELLVQWIMKRYREKIEQKMDEKRLNEETKDEVLTFIVENAYAFLTLGWLFILSVYLLLEYKVWLNWMVPALLTTCIPMFMFMVKRRKSFYKLINIMLLLFIVKYVYKKIKGVKR